MTKKPNLWLATDTAKNWLTNKPIVEDWLSKLRTEKTKSNYAYSLYRFCNCLNLSPSELMEIRSLDHGAIEGLRVKFGLQVSRH